MDNVYNLILPNFGKLTLIKQGDSSREEMVERFKNCENSILFGVSTFWQGVDMPGESLLAVILTHLPFEVPSSPIEEARIETIRNNGGNPFLEYQLPKAVMTLKQGFGRLIRRKTDYGLVAILDRRVQTKFYGRMFFNSLPKCRMTDNMEEVNLFFEEFTTKNVNRKY
jgi:ATP-dependent DNA helicase DinG